MTNPPRAALPAQPPVRPAGRPQALPAGAPPRLIDALYRERAVHTPEVDWRVK